jgi:rubrerythrin
VGHSRRQFIALAGAGSAAAVVAGCGGEDSGEQQRERKAADLEIVTFLLRVEEVEAAFFAQVEQRGGLGDEAPDDLVTTVADNEREHVAALERWVSRLGGDRPEAPPTDFDGIFAAGSDEVLASAASLENLSAAAYLGQINRVQDRNLLAAMLAIHTVEGRQAAAMNRLAGRGFSLGGPLEGAMPDGAFADPMEMDAVRVRLRRWTGGDS